MGFCKNVLNVIYYFKVEILDFTKRWRDSSASATSLHRHYPNLMDFDQTRYIDNSQLRLAIIFEQANLHVGIPILIESEDFTQITLLRRRHWSKLLNEITLKHVELIRHNQYLNVLHNLVQVNTKIDDATLRMCETYNSIPSTLILTDYLDDTIEPNEDTQHEMNRNKERERISTFDQQTIVIDVLTEQKSLTVDKENVINSTSRQMGHAC
ncbi:spectrin beta chain [Schistosoma japonicum]|nr:spectrin beta chain [Schistosoma japonicum]